MLPPLGMIMFKTGWVCKLTKSLYGLKSLYDSLFTKKTSSSFTVLFLYVDDIIVSVTLFWKYNRLLIF